MRRPSLRVKCSLAASRARPRARSSSPSSPVFVRRVRVGRTLCAEKQDCVRHAPHPPPHLTLMCAVRPCGRRERALGAQRAPQPRLCLCHLRGASRRPAPRCSLACAQSYDVADRVCQERFFDIQQHRVCDCLPFFRIDKTPAGRGQACRAARADDAAARAADAWLHLPGRGQCQPRPTRPAARRPAAQRRDRQRAVRRVWRCVLAGSPSCHNNAQCHRRAPSRPTT